MKIDKILSSLASRILAANPKATSPKNTVEVKTSGLFQAFRDLGFFKTYAYVTAGCGAHFGWRMNPDAHPVFKCIDAVQTAVIFPIVPPALAGLVVCDAIRPDLVDRGAKALFPHDDRE